MNKLLSKKEVRARVSVSFAQIDRWETLPEYRHLEFPKRIRIGSRVFWEEAAVNDWIERQLHPGSD